ncbi:MAG TPA: diiron oxygenase [Acidimicrobiales bacterium]|nr:diiron oxygenase [Acidimicrobiales bacterium]
MSEDLATTAARLAASSRKSYQNPYDSIAWPEAVDRCRWFTSPELISIFATPLWDGLDEKARRELSFWER